MEAYELPARLIRLATFLGRLVVHPTWAAANVANALEGRRDRARGATRDSQGKPVCSVEEALPTLTGAAPEDIAAVLARQPSVDGPRESSLYGSPDAAPELTALVYACCRLLRPEVVVETGVANGVTSAAILRALAENDRGTLVSIDLPHLHPRAAAGTGAAVPEELRDRWRLVLGPSRRALPRELEKVRSIGLLVQDGSHTTEGQLFDYRSAWPHLVPGGVLLSDDIGDAFVEFASEVEAEELLVAQARAARIGALRKL